jgi:hypothetical protein
MERETAKQAALQEDRKAIGPTFQLFRDSVFDAPPHLVEAVFLCPVGA